MFTLIKSSTRHWKHPAGLVVARLSGVGLGLYLLFSAPYKISQFAGTSDARLWVETGVLGTVGLIQLVPWTHIRSRRLFRAFFTLLVALTTATVFALVFFTMFTYIDMMSVGRKPGLPAFQGVVIFLSLLQVPTVLFLRHPEWME